ncbi:MAG: PadR family transcriptional regulator [Candidatus Micrarchaeia archaeon]
MKCESEEIKEYMKYLGFGVVKKHIDILLLWKISRKKSYGYEIMDEINKKCGFIVKLTPSKIYPALNKMEKNGILISKKIKQGKRVRKEYSISSKGKRILLGVKRLMKTGPAREFYSDMIQ